MPFDGIVTCCIVEELAKKLSGGRVEKVFQPEADEIILFIRSLGQNYKLLLSANPSYPRIHISGVSKENPQSPPMFCMLLRKHLSGGKLVSFEFHDFERIVTISIESLNELGDVVLKKLVIEIMGRHSNIILLNNDGKILDAIKHVDNDISSVREVMPARPYLLPPAQNKISPAMLHLNEFFGNVKTNLNVEKFLLEGIKGFSPLLCREVCHAANIDPKAGVALLSENQLNDLKKSASNMISDILNNVFSPCILYADKQFEKPLDFHCLSIKQYPYVKQFESISETLDSFYTSKDRVERLTQKKADIQKALKNHIERCNKKLSLQQDKLREVSDRENLKLFGELITANIYCIKKGMKSVSLLNYYSEDDEYIDIPLDENLLPQENAGRFFRQYAKAKSAYASTVIQAKETQKELQYLESVAHNLDNCNSLQEIDEIRQELGYEGYIALKKPSSGFKKQEKASSPIRYKSTDGFEILVGKNNKQNDYLTMKLASSNDIWMHARNIPGSHVIIRKNQNSIPDNTLLEAAKLAAYHSKYKMSSNVPVDYTAVRHVKKPGGAKPGMVIYENFKTIIVTPDEESINRLKV